MKKLELLGALVSFVLSVFFYIKACNTDIPVNYLLCSWIALFIGLALGYDAIGE